jgi:NADH-quinone oxidoreductase subunit F
MKQLNYLTGFAKTPDPLDIDQYTRDGGFVGLQRAIGLDRHEVIRTVKSSGLQGRGGAGFSTGLKWSTVHTDEETYLVCNADEGEPGTFKDRFLMDTAPYLILEGMAIAGYAVGAKKGYIYIRSEYPEITAKLEEAIRRANETGVLGESILGTQFDFSVGIMKGGGSYVVGDETALLSSLMGNRGYPTLKPPYPTEKGLWEKPTVINNVETLACVPLILSRGAEWFSKIGSPESPGPKLYCVSGHVKNAGVYEFPMGIAVGELLDAAGGPDGRLKAVQIGGTAGPVYDERALEYKLDFAHMKEVGGTLGSGAVVAMNTTVNMAHVLEVIMRFFSEESCGQCFACRYGTRQLEYMANRIATGQGRTNYLRLVRETAEVMYHSSLCPFGQSVSLPANTLLDAFGDELRAYIGQQDYVREVSA